MKKYIPILLMLFVSLSLSAKNEGGGQDEKPQFELKKHEFALNGAFYPGRYATGYDFGNHMKYYNLGYYSHTVTSAYLDATRYNKEIVTNSWTFQYTYNFNRTFALQGGLSYEGAWDEWYSRADNSLLNTEADHLLTAMVTLRVSWLNRNIVRLYSSLGLGATFSLVDREKRYDKRDKAYFAGQFAPIGISVGKDVFGFVELGVGTVYMIGCCGIAYRF